VNAINLNLIQAAALPQQAQSGATTSAPADSRQFALWLSQAGLRGSSAIATSAPDAASQAQRLAQQLPASTMALLQQLSLDDPAATSGQPLAAADTAAGRQEVMDAIISALLDAIREILDAGNEGSAAAQPQAEATLAAGDSAASGAGADKQPATAQAALKQAAVMWLQGNADAVKQTGVTWLQDSSGVTKQATGLQTLLEQWPQLAQQLQNILGERFGLDIQTSSAVVQAWPAAQAPVPWTTAAAAADTGLPAQLQAWLSLNGASQMLVADPNGASAAQAAPSSALEGLGNAPASIRWFAAGGSGAKLTAQATAATLANMQSTPVAVADIVLADGTSARLAVMPATQTAVTGPTGPQAATAANLAAGASNFTVALYSPAEELPLLTAQLSVQKIAEPSLLLPVTSWNPEALLGAQGSRLDPAGTDVRPVTEVNSNTTASRNSLPIAAPALASVLQDTAATRLDVEPAVTLASMRGASPQRTGIMRDSQFRLSNTAEAVSSVELPAAITQTVQAASAAGIVQPATQRLQSAGLKQSAGISAQAADSAAAQLEPSVPQRAALLRSGSPSTVVAAATTGFTALSASRTATKIANWDTPAQITTSTNSGLAFGQLPAQLMQFSGRELDVRTYSGLEFRDLAGKLLEQANAARSQGDGLYRTTLDLNPPSLGRMSVNIAVRGDNVALQLAVASSVPREQLKGNLAALQQSLEEAGLNVVELKVVTVDPDGQPAKQYREQQTQPQPDATADDEALNLAFSQALGASSA
jgi:flagellar hook-length control protein FliK